jgi:hypothetical protein
MFGGIINYKLSSALSHYKEKLNYSFHSLSDNMKNVVYLELMEWWTSVSIDLELEQGREKR